MKRLQYLLLLLILIGAFTVRLYRFDNPVADWHSWRQSDTSAVSRNFVKYGFDILYPKFDDLSNVPSGLDNPKGLRFVEFPIYNIFQAVSFKLFGIFSIEEWGRLITIFSSVISTIFIYLIVKKYSSELAGIFAAFFYSFIPYNIYFGRVILPDPMMVMGILGGIYFFDRWTTSLVILRAKPEESRSFPSQRRVSMTLFFFLSLIFTASAFLLKPYALFFTLPIIYLAFKNFGIKTLINWKLWIFAIVTVLPLVFWRNWMQQYPEGIPVNDWLFNGGNIRFKPSFFYWIFADRIGRLILGYWGVAILAIGLLQKKGKGTVFFLTFLLSSLIYITVIARGNVQHDYYQIAIVPSIAIFLGLGAEALLTLPKEYFNRTISYAFFIVSVGFMLFFGWYNVRDFFNINNRSIVVGGSAVNKLTPQNAKVIAPYDGDTSFLYHTNRQGWASFQRSLPEMIEMGATHLVFVNTKPSDYNLGKEYKIVSATPDYILFDLLKKP